MWKMLLFDNIKINNHKTIMLRAPNWLAVALVAAMATMINIALHYIQYIYSNSF